MDSTDGKVLHVNYDMGTELASYLMEDPIEMEELSSSLHDPSGIGLHLECEDDKSYALPFSKSSLRLHSNNVSMRISFSSANDSLSCRYCKCNFLSESHLGKHMQQFHLESGDDYEDRWDGTDDELAPGSNHTNGTHYSIPSPRAAATFQPTLFSAAGPKKEKTLKAKRKSLIKDRQRANPPITLTIKKSKSDSEIQQEEQDPVAGSPAAQMLQVKCEVLSDSANETIDVESSSPSSSPTSVKSRLSASFSLKKHVSGKPFTCDICMKTYVSKYALKRHIATHSDERPFICNFPGCKGAFKLKSRLTDHVRYVHKKKHQRTVSRSKSLPITATPALAQALLSPSSLSISSNSSSNSNGVIANGKGSSAPKTFKCSMPNCTREFRDSHNLRTHMCLHTGHMPLKCPHCEYRCVQKSALDWHTNNTHPKSLWRMVPEVALVLSIHVEQFRDALYLWSLKLWYYMEMYCKVLFYKTVDLKWLHFRKAWPEP